MTFWRKLEDTYMKQYQLSLDIRNHIKIKRNGKNTFPAIVCTSSSYWLTDKRTDTLLKSCFSATLSTNHLPLPVRPCWPSCFWLVHSYPRGTVPCPACITVAGSLQFCVPRQDEASLSPLGVFLSLSSPPAFLAKVSDLANARHSVKALKQWDAVYVWNKRL